MIKGKRVKHSEMKDLHSFKLKDFYQRNKTVEHAVCEFSLFSSHKHCSVLKELEKEILIQDHIGLVLKNPSVFSMSVCGWGD